MNIYFLVEGKRTEMKVYPKWLSLLIPELTRVDSHEHVTNNNYYIFSGNGYPSLLHNHLRNSIDDVNDVGQYDYFVICLDSDEQSIADCEKEILDFIAAEGIILNPITKLVIIVQNKCLESWFLGNTKIFKKNPSSSFLRDCVMHYNVKKEDPELMLKPANFDESTSVFHASYLQELLAERGVNYTKKNPQAVTEKYYLEELIIRSNKTRHISSFMFFINFCSFLRKSI